MSEIGKALGHVLGNLPGDVSRNPAQSATSSMVDEAVGSGQYTDTEQASMFIFAENFDTFDTAAEGGEPDGVVSQADIEAVAENASGEYPPELVEFARYLLSQQNEGLLDRLDKGAGVGGDDGDISWQDVATVLSYEEPSPQATQIQQAQFVQTQLEAIVNAEREGDFDVIETNEAMERVLDNAPVDDPAFAAALVSGMAPEDFARLLELAPYSDIAGTNGTEQLQRIMAAAMTTETGERALNALLQHVLTAEAAYDTIYAQVNMILGSAQYGTVPTSILQAIAAADQDPGGYLGGLIDTNMGSGGVTVAFFEALATNPAAAISILEQYPDLLLQAHAGGNPEFAAAMDSLLASMAAHVESSGRFDEAAKLAFILDQLGQYGAPENQQALADAIEKVMPLLVAGIASEDVGSDEAAVVAALAGNLVQHYVAMVGGDDPQACVDAVTTLLEGMTADMELTPEAYGTVLGLLTAGLLKHFDQIRMSDEDQQAVWSGLLQTAGAATGFWTSPWGVALGTGFQAVASIVDLHGPRDYEEFARVFQGSQGLALLKDEVQFPGYQGDGDPALVALAWMEAMINLNGHP